MLCISLRLVIVYLLKIGIPKELFSIVFFLTIDLNYNVLIELARIFFTVFKE